MDSQDKIKWPKNNFLKEMAIYLGVSDIASEVLDNTRFFVWSGSSKKEQHHYGTGGLSQHIKEVFQLCDLSNDYFNEIVDRKSLFLACLFHDAGKMWDYEIDAYGEWQGTTHKRRIHHVAKSAIVWSIAVQKYPKYKYMEDDVLHAILAHHGRREWGSPVAPNTRLAWLLHLNDGISARMEDCDRLDRVK